MEKKDWFSALEIIVLSGVAAISAIVSLSDFIGILSVDSWLAKRISTLTLLAIALIAAYLSIERRKYLIKLNKNSTENHKSLISAIEKEGASIADSTTGVQIRTFANNQELMTYVVRKLKDVKESVDDLTWSHIISLRQELPAQKKVEDAYQKRISELSTKIQYREIFIFNKESRISKLKKRLEENAEGYSCTYYKKSDIPPIQFLLIDKNEIIFASAIFPIKCAIRSEKICQIFSAYYEEAWKESEPIKLGSKIFQNTVNEIICDQKNTIEIAHRDRDAHR